MNATPCTELINLDTVADVIDALGGNALVMELTDSKSIQTVTNWRYSNRAAHQTYLIMSTALEQRGYRAPSELWGIKSVGSDALESAAP